MKQEEIDLDAIMKPYMDDPRQYWTNEEVKACMTEAIRQALLPYQWIEIKTPSALPMKGENLLVWNGNYISGISYYNDGWHFWYDDGQNIEQRWLDDITHYCIPKPPIN